MAKKATYQQVNAALKVAGYDAKIVRGKDYIYFVGPDAANETAVYTPRISDMTAQEWVEEFVSQKQ